MINSLPKTFVIFDTEFTAWLGSQQRNWSLPTEEKELVQIGALKIKKLKTTIKIIEKFNIYIKPTINPELSSYFINLTNIDQATIDTQGVSFKEAMKLFYQFSKDKDGKKIDLYSYGNDYDIIYENLKLNKYPKKSKFYTWEKNFVDIKNLFEPYVDVEKYSSGKLYKAFKLRPQKVEVHNSLWDSISLFISLKHILTRFAFKMP